MSRVVIGVFAVGLVSLAGCAPSACKVMGTVTQDGQPLNSATIAFEPQDMVGPAAMVPVKNGQFEVPESRQLVAGKYLVRITPGAWMGGADVPTDFPPFTTTVNLNLGLSEVNFDVPKPPPAPKKK